MLLYVRGRVDATRDDLMTAAADGLLMKRRQTDESMLEEVMLSRFYADNVVIETKAIEAFIWRIECMHANIQHLLQEKEDFFLQEVRSRCGGKAKKDTHISNFALRFLSLVGYRR